MAAVFKNLRSLSFFLIVSLVSNVSYAASPVPEKTDPNIYAADSTKIKVVENFDNRAKKNRVGGLWAVTASPESELKYDFKRSDALNDFQGSSLRIVYKAAPSGSVYLESDLNNLDISQARELRFWLMSAGDDEHRISILLSDSNGRSAQIPIKRFSRVEDRRSWQEVRIPLREFYGVDTNNLKTFRLIIQGEKEGVMQGVFFFDQLVFSGDDDVVFWSLADNLMGFPRNGPLKEFERFDLMSLPADTMLLKIAKLTWNYFANLVDKKTHLPVDNIHVGKYKAIGDYTSPTNIGLYLMCIVAAQELGFITREEALKRIGDTLKTLKKLKKWQGFPYNFYNVTNLQVTRNYVSAVDSGWLAAGLIVIRKAFPREFSNQADHLLGGMNFGVFYDKSIGQIRLGYDADEKSMAPFHYGLLVSEARVMSLIAIAKGDVPEEHWYKINRTPPPEWDWQTQKPTGEEKEVEGRWVFKGMYRYKDFYIVPSWGGSMFEYLMPTLVLKEKDLSPQGLGKNDDIAARVQIEYALNDKRYPVWGLSPCAYPGGYGEFGIKEIGVKGYQDFGIITPHASLLALEFRPKSVLKNIRSLLKYYPILGEYGFYDSVKMRGRDRVAPAYLALDQGMILLSIANFLKRGVIRRYFHEDPKIKKIEHLLIKERFFS